MSRKTSPGSQIARFIRGFVILFVSLMWIVGVIGSWLVDSYEVDWIEEEETEVLDPLCGEFAEDGVDETGEPQRNIQRSWMAYYYENIYCTRYGIGDRARKEATSFRSNLQIYWEGDYVKFWNTLYASLAKHDAPSLTHLGDSLGTIARDRQLSQKDAAMLVVSFVQDIPYQFVISEPCTGSESKPCNGRVDYGIYSPAEFAYSLKGDCDTRTVLLYTLLEHLGFDAVIFNSYEYAHSMLGISLPFAGDYLTYKGKRYYFWETTNVGWMPGQIPPEWSNTDYWTVVLD